MLTVKIKQMGLCRALQCWAFLVLIFSAPSYARAPEGKGVGADGGDSLPLMFDEARSSIEAVLADLSLLELRSSRTCSEGDLTFAMESKVQLQNLMLQSTLSWKGSSGKAETSQQCITIEGNALVLDPENCRPEIRDIADARLLLLDALVSRLAQRQPSIGLPSSQAKCLAAAVTTALDGYYRPSLSQPSSEDFRMTGVNITVQGLRSRLEQSRGVATRALLNLESNNISMVSPSGRSIDLEADAMTRWLNSRLTDGRLVFQALAEEIASMPLHVSDQSTGQKSCAHTNLQANAAVTFDLTKCSMDSVTLPALVRTLIHEATHHAPFGITNEFHADLIAEFIASKI